MAKTKTIPYEIPLHAALEFISVAQRPNGKDHQQQYCKLGMFAAVAFDGVIAAGIKIIDDLNCCPNTARLIAALANCKPGFTMSHAAVDRLLVQSDDFQAHVPLCDPQTLPWVQPDRMQMVVDDRLRAAIKAVGGIVNDKSTFVHEASILLQARTVIATDGAVVLEAFHGHDLPPGILLPKVIAGALVKAGKTLTGVGYGTSTVTFWFGDECWIRTQRFVESYPDAAALLNTPTEMRPIPPGLFAAVDQLAPFSEDGFIYCAGGRASSHKLAASNTLGARLVLDVAGIEASRIYSIASMKVIKPIATHYDDTALRDRTFFQGGMDVKLGTRKADSIRVPVRGVMVHRTDDPAPVDPNAPVHLGGLQPCSECGGDPRSCECVPF